VKTLIDDRPRTSSAPRRALDRAPARRRRVEATLRALGVGATLAGLGAATLLPLPLVGPWRGAPTAPECRRPLLRPACLWAEIVATPSPTSASGDGGDEIGFEEALRFFPDAGAARGPLDP